MTNCNHIRVETEINNLTNQIYDLMVNCNNVGISTQQCGDLCDLQFGNADSYVYEQAFNNAKERAMAELILDFNGDE